ncbi:toxin-antitoxin system YwqK family antitoxin [Pontibacter sp. MBLB2868]|uniref:toxin-antitoxin system YwqK family antitoxin n=1 Tax=Pontibacter sp. MBLB2868 TaxID=3451555 RepID=UPI003F74B2AE
MRISLLVSFLFVVAASCSPKTYVVISNELRYGDLSDGLPDLDSTVTLNYESGKVKAVGKYALADDKTSDNLKAGFWKEYHENGSLKNEGNYKLGSYLQCSMGGLWREYYSYRYGMWKYFDEKGELKYEVEFTPSSLHVKTSCEGGDSLIFGLIKAVPLEYAGSLKPDMIYELQKVETEQDFGSIIYTPLNGNLYINWKQ